MEFHFGETIKKLRLDKGVTQEDVADYVGVSFQAVSKWETDTTMPDITLLPRLAMFFGVRIDDLFAVNTDEELSRIDHMLEHETLTDQNVAYAKQILDTVLRDHPDDVGAIKRYARLYLSRTNRDMLTAGRMLEHAMSLTPLDPEIYTLYRQTRGGDMSVVRSGHNRFIRTCEPYARKYPQNTKLYELLIEAMIEMRYFDRANAMLALMHPADEDRRSLPDILRGDVALAQGDPETAKQLWNAVDPNSHKGQYEVGERFSRIGEYDAAITCFERSFSLATPPRDLSAVYSLAFLYTKLGRTADAISCWQRILDVLAADHNITDGETVDWAHREIQKLRTPQ